MFSTTFYSAMTEIQQITEILNSMGHRICSGSDLSKNQIKENTLQQENRIALLELQQLLINYKKTIIQVNGYKL
jgi:hypothetical protein